MANLQISNLSQSRSDRRQALTFHSITDNRHHHQQLTASSSSRSPDLDNIVGNSDEPSVKQPAASTPSSSGSGLFKAKKRKMATENLNLSNDSGIPMEGVELDSSTVSRGTSSPTNHPLASTTNSNPSLSGPLGNTTSNLTNNNEALASDSLSLSNCDETKCYSPDYGTSIGIDQNTSTEENSFNTSQNEKGGQTNFIRSFGELFDDDDLD